MERRNDGTTRAFTSLHWRLCRVLTTRLLFPHFLIHITQTHHAVHHRFISPEIGPELGILVAGTIPELPSIFH